MSQSDADLACLKTLVLNLTNVVNELKNTFSDFPKAVTDLANNVRTVQCTVSSHDTKILQLEDKMEKLAEHVSKLSSLPQTTSSYSQHTTFSDVVKFRAEEEKFSSRSVRALWFKVQPSSISSVTKLKKIISDIFVLSKDQVVIDLFKNDHISCQHAASQSGNPPIIITCPSKDVRDKVVAYIRKFKHDIHPDFKKTFVRRDYLPSEINLERDLRNQCKTLNVAHPDLAHFVRDFKIVSKPRTIPASEPHSANPIASTVVLDASAHRPILSLPALSSPPIVVSTPRSGVANPSSDSNSGNASEPSSKVTKMANGSRNIPSSQPTVVSSEVSDRDRFRKTQNVRRSMSLPRSTKANLQAISSAIGLTSFRK
ncbi:unnamed protein product [Auanema sp. JU1783]|nr:unnamed protein product [Auanema sp. JU1783]